MECAVIAEDLCCDAIFVSDAQMNSIQISNTPGTDLNHIFANDYTLTGAKFPTPEIQKFSSGMSCAIFTEDLYCHAIFVSNAKMISIPVSNTEVTELNHIVANSDSSGFGSPWTVPWIPTLAWTRMERSVRAEYLHCLTVFMPNRKMSPINGSNTERSNLDNIFVHGHTGRSSEFIGPRIETSMWPMQARTIIEIYLRCIAILVTNTEMRSVHVFDAEFTDLNCVVSNFYATWGTKVPTPKIVIGAWPGMECAVIAEDLCCDAIFVSDAQMNSIQISNTPGTDLNHIAPDANTNGLAYIILANTIFITGYIIIAACGAFPANGFKKNTIGNRIFFQVPFFKNTVFLAFLLDAHKNWRHISYWKCYTILPSTCTCRIVTCFTFQSH